MTTINAGSSFYRVQNALDANSKNVSDSMLRLATGKANVGPGDRTANQLVASSVSGELASLKAGIKNGAEVLNALEMVTNDIASLNNIINRLMELNTMGQNELNSSADVTAIKTEATALLAEFQSVQDRSLWKGQSIIGATAGDNDVGFGNGQTMDIELTGNSAAGFAADITDTKISLGTASASSAGVNFTALKVGVDAMQLGAGSLYNKAENNMSHMTNLAATYQQDIASKTDVDFAGETTELAKGQILAQAGTAMLAQANAQGQGMLALIQS